MKKYEYECDLSRMIEYIKDKTLYVFGAGIQGERWVYILEDYGFSKNIKGIVDNSITKQGRYIKGNALIYPIISLEHAIADKNGEVCFLIASIRATEMEKQLLGEIEILHNEREFTYIRLDNVASNQLMKSNYPKIVKESEHELIPRTIHYCWLGREMPDKLKKNIENWKKWCPDYEIKCWNENNYDIKKNKYMLQAYNNAAWAFATDYMRLDIIWNEGGIYLDTDIEIVRNIDELLYQSSFACADSSFVPNLGSGYGSVAKNVFIKELMDYYENVSFLNDDGSLNKTTCNTHNYQVFRKYGYKAFDQLQCINGMNIYPMEFSGICPYKNHKKNITDNTFWVHYGNMSWM